MINKSKNRNVADVTLHRKNRKDRINSGNPEIWNIKDCAAILGTDYLRNQFGYQAWIRIKQLENYELSSKD
ncbi:hypothetical protein [Acinetobacter sp. Marseille-Q1618]|uniref:hypothetical protein n=1 Tax=Acinetobacter sp. Marseille-Q1618 TaxID=2697502 RepID=UPI00156F3D36|nr:hypothetical protein [Acinetobacter sp. Marseille-Q1618]